MTTANSGVNQYLSEYEQVDIGSDLFRAACGMGLEDIVSKRLDRTYGAGKCRVKNPAHPAYSRARMHGDSAPTIVTFSANSTD